MANDGCDGRADDAIIHERRGGADRRAFWSMSRWRGGADHYFGLKRDRRPSDGQNRCQHSGEVTATLASQVRPRLNYHCDTYIRIRRTGPGNTVLKGGRRGGSLRAWRLDAVYTFAINYSRIISSYVKPVEMETAGARSHQTLFLKPVPLCARTLPILNPISNCLFARVAFPCRPRRSGMPISVILLSLSLSTGVIRSQHRISLG
jgi:hypothetical protein